MVEDRFAHVDPGTRPLWCDSCKQTSTNGGLIEWAVRPTDDHPVGIIRRAWCIDCLAAEIEEMIGRGEYFAST